MCSLLSTSPLEKLKLIRIRKISIKVWMINMMKVINVSTVSWTLMRQLLWEMRLMNGELFWGRCNENLWTHPQCLLILITSVSKMSCYSIIRKRRLWIKYVVKWYENILFNVPVKIRCHISHMCIQQILSNVFYIYVSFMFAQLWMFGNRYR